MNIFHSKKRSCRLSMCYLLLMMSLVFEVKFIFELTYNNNPKPVRNNLVVNSSISQFSTNTTIHKDNSVWNAENKVIWSCWFDGWNNTKKLSKVVIEAKNSWEYYTANDSWKIILLSRENINNYVESDLQWDIIYNRLSAKHFFHYNNSATIANILRIYLLYKYGGLWLDATVFLTGRLDEWLLPYANDNNFFAFSQNNFKGTWTQMWSNWLLFAPTKNNYIVKKLYEGSLDFWFDDEYNIKVTTKPIYFWMHELFYKLYTNDLKFKQIWDDTKHLNSTNMSYMTDIPLRKLTHKKFKPIFNTLKCPWSKHKTIPNYCLFQNYTL